jgi:hypothetical protein
MQMASMVMLAQVFPPPLQTGSTLHVHFAEPTAPPHVWRDPHGTATPHCPLVPHV